MKDKTTIIVVVICLVVLIGGQTLLNKVFPPQPKKTPPATASEKASQESQVPELRSNTVAGVTGAVATVESEPPTREVDLPPRPAEETITLSNEFLRATFTSWGGGIQAVELLKHLTADHQPVVVNGSNYPPALAIRNLPGAATNDAYTIEKVNDRSVRMHTRTREGVEVTKTVELEGDYLSRGEIKVASSPNQSLQLFVGSAQPVDSRETQDLLGVGWLEGSKYHVYTPMEIFKKAGKGIENEVVQARWVAVKNQFFTAVLTPQTNVTTVGFREFTLKPSPGWKDKHPPQGLTAWGEFPPTATNEQTQTYAFSYYAGPKQYQRLVALGDGEEEVMQFGFWGLISVLLLRGMNFFYSLIPNYGVTIILITIIIKILFWPIQAKSMKSMQQMQKFQPMMQKLREKYKDDAARMNQEMMKLYKEHKINPFAGCLPMLVQIPVFLAFYTMLRSAIELRGASFIWIRDLSQPDTIAHLAGFPINPLPLVMGLSMVGQMKLTPSGGDPKQQQMMMFMPIVFLFICYNMSSGLVLYWTVQQLLSIAQQWRALKHTNSTTPALVTTPPRPPSKPMSR